MLLAAVAPLIRFTVPKPAKSPPLMLLAMLRVLLPLLKMPPPLPDAELPERVELETVTVPPLPLPPPPPKLKMPPPPLPFVAVLPERVELVMVAVPLL